MTLEPSDVLSHEAAEIESTIFALYRLLRRPFEADAAGSGLTVPQITVLEELANEDGLSLKELSRRLSLTHSTVSGIIDRLEKRKLVQRTTDEQDRRTSRILLSPTVRAYIQEVVPPRRLESLQEALRAATPEEKQTILAGLRTLKALMEVPSRT